MASVGTKECLAEDAENPVNTESAGFQKKMFELFEKNGILNDLRAYLRCQIVDVLKNAETGGLPACQKHFTQRLEPPSQALNILVAEYLQKYEFSYSLSVFISEIPLANMVFGYAKSLLQTDSDDSKLKFEDADVWTILNYLGIQCDSEHAASVLDMYKNDKHHPLLLCILKAMPMYHPIGFNCAKSSDAVLVTPRDSVATLEDNSIQEEKCNHFAICKLCQNRVIKVKEKYKKKKKNLAKHATACDVNTQIVENVIKNVTVMEQNIMDEMFEHLKSVYETEIVMLKTEEESKVKHSVVSHRIELQRKCDELEQSYRAREAELEHNIQQKKKFLWGLAQALRAQHNTLNNAMEHVQIETGRLSAKEESLKTQLAEAETELKQKSEDMRSQISNELSILSEHLESMKIERDKLLRERNELDTLKSSKNNIYEDSIRSHYELIEKELCLLRSYMESSRNPKCLIERATNTANVLNNIQERTKVDLENKLKTNQLINDFRKKNVNFAQDNVEHPTNRSSSPSTEGGDTVELPVDWERALRIVRCLRDENARLRRQQRDYRERLENLPPTLVNPGPVLPVGSTARSSALPSGWFKGAGEELTVLRHAQRVLTPADTLPFCAARARGATRQLMTHWRGSRTRCPIAGVSKRTISPLRDRKVSTSLSGHSSSKLQGMSVVEEQPNTSSSCRDKQTMRERVLVINENRDTSQKSVQRETKDKSRSHLVQDPVPPRDTSPTTVVRDAKLRLRKLEIEAEAVEESYRKFKQRQSELPELKSDVYTSVGRLDTRNRAQKINRNIVPSKSQRIHTHPIDIPSNITQGFKTLILNYNKINTKLNQNINKRTQENFLEKPLNEFRKFYRSEVNNEESGMSINECDNINIKETISPPTSSEKDNIKKVKDDQDTQFEILKQNIDRIYNNDNVQEELTSEPKDSENLIHIEVESAIEIHDIPPTNDLVLVVSSVETPQVTISGNIESNKPSNEKYGPKFDETDLKSHEEKPRRSESPEKAANLTKNDVLDAIFQAEATVSSSVQTSVNEYEKDYPDDFSADNYNSKSENEETQSPISQAQDYEDDDFWNN